MHGMTIALGYTTFHRREVSDVMALRDEPTLQLARLPAFFAM